MNLPIIPTIKSVTDLRYQTAEIIGLLAEGEPVVVTRDTSAVAVMLSPSKYAQILAEVEDKNETSSLETAIKKGGEFVDFNSFDKRQRKKHKLS